MKQYKWNGKTYQINDKDLHMYPGAELITDEKESPAPANKNKASAPNKSRQARSKSE